MTFEKWILTKIKENNSIGDLARDFKRACQIDKEMYGLTHQKLDENHLLRWGAYPIVYEALENAREVYEEEANYAI